MSLRSWLPLFPKGCSHEHAVEIGRGRGNIPLMWCEVCDESWWEVEEE